MYWCNVQKLKKDNSTTRDVPFVPRYAGLQNVQEWELRSHNSLIIPDVK